MSTAVVHLVNSFVNDTPFSGSQCAVVILDHSDPRFDDTAWLDGLSSNFNLPATAALRPQRMMGKLVYDLRWFASGELPFCGHGTLAAAHTIFDKFPDHDVIEFLAKPGRLLAERKGESLQLKFPGLSIDRERPGDWDDLLVKLGEVTPLCADVVNIAAFNWGARCLIFEVRGDADLGGAKINGAVLGVLQAPMVIITQRIGETASALKIASRVFLPTGPMTEDPATGSAHTALTCYYATHPFPQSQIQLDLSTSWEIEATQLSPRGGEMETRYQDGSVIVTARAAEWARGALL